MPLAMLIVTLSVCRIDGYVWQSLDNEEKTYTVCVYQQAATTTVAWLYANGSIDERAARDAVPIDIEPDVLVSAIDQFYHNPSNMQASIGIAIYWMGKPQRRKENNIWQ